MKRLKFSLHQTGDTIVEVLVATAILAAVLGGAYTISSRSLRSGRIAQERIEALKLIEGQLERLEYEAKNSSGFDSTYRISNYCLSVNPATGLTQINNNPNPPNDVYSDSCISTLYRINITYVVVDHSVPNKFLGTFSAQAIWERIGGGQEQDEVIINYQL